MTMGDFVYEPIDICSFRLLRLFKGRKYNVDNICCELYEAPHPSELDGGVDTYEALSYTWGCPDDTPGSPNEPRAILVNGHQVSVTKNLYDALYHLRYRWEDRIVWVDALCINQKDATERSLQVRRMRVIYEKAQSVIIWLGESSGRIKLLMETVRDLDRRLLRCPRPRGKDRLEVWLDEGRSYVTCMAPGIFQVSQEALAELLERSWFQRVWVIQEAAVASRATIQCSWDSATTSTFALMPQLMDVSHTKQVQALLEIMPGPLRERSWWRQDRSLSTLLRRFDESKATDERDQIFAFLGISVDAAVFDCPLKADYGADMAEIIRRTTSFLVYGDILDDSPYPLPVLPLGQLRHTLPYLRQKVYEWALKTDGNHAPLLRRLIHGMPRINLNRGSDDGLHPIQALICKKSAAEEVGVLLECEEFKINNPVGLFTPLSYASSRGRDDIVRLLLGREDIDPWRPDPDGKSSLERAIENDHVEIIDILLDYPGLTYIVSSSFLRRMESAIAFAAKEGKTSIISHLLSRVLSPVVHNPISWKNTLTEAMEKNQNKTVEVLIDYPASWETALAPTDFPEAATLLSSAGNYPAPWETALAKAKAFWHKATYRKVSVTKITTTKDPEAATSPWGITLPEDTANNTLEALKTPVEIDSELARSRGREARERERETREREREVREREREARERERDAREREREARERERDARARERDGLLATAVLKGLVEDARILLDAGANPNTLYAKDTLLGVTLQYSNAQLAELLIDKGADVNSRNPGGSTRLITAACRCDVEMVKLLVDRGADIEATEDGCNAFWHAVIAGNRIVAEFLANQGADLTVPKQSLCFEAWVRNENWLPLTPARLERKQESINFLLDVGVFPHKDGPSSWRTMCQQHLR